MPTALAMQESLLSRLLSFCFLLILPPRVFWTSMGFIGYITGFRERGPGFGSKHYHFAL